MFKTKEFMGKRVLSSSFLEDDSSICAFFTTRDLPLKYGERDDLISQIPENKKLVAAGFDIPAQNVIIPVQTHSDNVEIIRRTAHKGLEKNVFPNCDGLVTAEKGIAIALNFADCVPLIFYDSVKKVIASSHAGWRGTASKIGVKTVMLMQGNFGCQPQDIVALIGPSISRCCFEVKEDVKNKLLNTVKVSERASVCDKMNVDLKLINKLQLQACGVEKIDTSDYCTSCRSDLFYSYRKENGHTARHSAVIVLK